MYDHSLLSRGLREHLLAVAGGSPTREQVNKLIAVCHALASSFLSSKSSSGTLIRIHGLSISDLAYDCIADLFRQDDRGEYIQIASYFASIPFETTSIEELLAHLRRLVFSKVNHGIFRLCAEADPSLAKILRNVKLAVQSLGHFRETERLGEPCIVPVMCDPLDHRIPFSREELEKLFLAATTGDERIPEILGKLSRALRAQSDRCRIIPLVAAGVHIRAAYERKMLSVRSDAEPPSDPFANEAFTRSVRDACAHVHAQTRDKYVGRGKVPEEMFGLYFRTIEEELCARYDGGEAGPISLFEILSRNIPSLTRSEYAERHRNQLEYLLKLVKQESAGRLRNS